MSGPARVHLHIDTLVVEGLSGLSRAPLVETLQRELAQRIAAGMATRAWEPGHRPAIDGGAFELRPGTGSRAVGRHVAAAIDRALGPTR